MKTRILFLFTLLCAAFASVQLVHAATFTVTNTNDSGSGTLRQAILDANANAGVADTINFDSGVTGAILLLSALPNLADDVTISGPGANVLTVRRPAGICSDSGAACTPGDTSPCGNPATATCNATPNFRIFTVNAGKTVNISGLTISGGIAGGSTYPDNSGGGIFNLGTLGITNSTISGNSAALAGGGIANDGHSVTLTSSFVTGNSATIGGGLYSAHVNANLIVTNCTINGNTANSIPGTSGAGGGIYNNGSLASVPGATLTVSNSTLSGNSAPSQDGEGGAIYNDGEGGHAFATVKNCTLSANSARSGGGILNQSVGNAGPRALLTIGSTILNAGSSGANIVNQAGTITSLGYNLSSDAAGGDGTTAPGGFLNNTGDIRNTPPMLAGLANNGGPTFTHAIDCDSPAADHGKNFDNLTTDQRGTGFPRAVGSAAAQGGDGTDIGAFEVQTVCNQPPTAVNDGYSTDEDTALAVNAPGVLGNDSDPDSGDTITAVLVSGPSYAASFALNSDGSFSYTPSSNYNGGDSFTYKAVDSHNAESNVATVNITINAVNDPPTISGGTISRVQNGGSSNSQIATVSDVDNSAGSLTVTVQSAPTGITATNIVNTNGTVTADVAAGCSAAVGSNTVVLQVSDGQANTNGNLTVTVTANTVAPVITPKAPAVLQPAANHGYHTFTIAQMVQSATDDCDGNVINNVVIEKGTSDELEDSPGGGDGNTGNDIVIAANCKSVQLRAERDGTLNGRVYLVTLRVSDSSGNIARATYNVSVPVGHNAAVDSGVHYTVNSSCN